MNRQFILDVADAIERLNRGEKVDGLTEFDMSTFKCGTAGCIAGTAVALTVERGDGTWNRSIAIQAKELMDLPEEIADALFCGYWPDNKWLGELDIYYRARDLNQLTAARAAAVCRDLAHGRLRLDDEGWLERVPDGAAA